MVNNRRFLRLFLWLLPLGLLVWVIRTVPFGEIWAVLRQLSFWQIGLLVVANGAALLTLNGRWQLILRGHGFRIPHLALMAHRLAAFGVSYFTPGPQFGGEPVQVMLVERLHGVPRATALSAVGLDKTLELLANFGFLLAGTAVILQSGLLVESGGWGTAVLALLLLLLPVVFLIATWRGWRPVSRLWRLGARLPVWRWRPHWQERYLCAGTAVQSSETQAARFCRERPLTLALALLISGVSWAALVGEYWLMLTFLGGPVTLAQTIIIMTAARIAFLLPAPGGLGALEASQMVAFTALGLNPAAAISASLLIRVRDIALGGIGLLWGSRQLRQVNYERNPPKHGVSLPR